MCRPLRYLIALWCIAVTLGFVLVCQNIYESNHDSDDAYVSESSVRVSDAHAVVSRSVVSGDLSCDNSDTSDSVMYHEAVRELNHLVPGSIGGTFFDDTISVREFLRLLSECSSCIAFADDCPVYLLGESSFLSASEFDSLTANLDDDLARCDFDMVLSRLNNMRDFVKSCDNISSVDGYEDLIWGYYREFWDLYNTNPGCAKFWLQDVFSSNLGVDRFSSVLHEMSHEESARLSYGYSHRSCKNHNWQVVWFDNVRTMHSYNLKTHGFSEIAIKDLPRTQDVLDFSSISRSVRDTVWFKTYVNRQDVISNLFSIYGMTEEFCANMIDVKFAIISDMIGYHGKVLSDDDLRPYYFWTSLICEYILSVKESDYNAYNQIIQDEALMSLLRDVYQEIVYYTDFIGVAYSNTWDSVALKSWYESPRIQMAAAEYFGS